ncbi:putative ribonuclease H-like domain-containing protein, partial [Tanacetum coccineum]
MIPPPVSVEEQIVVQRETKARTILLQSLPEDHMADFHHLDDAMDIWLAVKARFGDNFGSDEVFDLSAPSIFDSSPKDVAEKPLHDRFVKTVRMHAVPPPLTGTFMPPSNNPDLDETQFTYGSKSNNNFETNSVSNDFVSCDNSDKSSDSETTDFASCVSSVKSSSSKTNEPLASTPSSVDFKTMTETADQQPSSTKDNPSFSFKENVKPPRNLCNKSGVNSRSLCNRKSFGSKTCFVCGSKFHLIKDCDFYEKQLELNNKPMWTNVANIPSFVPKAASVPAGSRNRQTSVPTGSRNRTTSVPAGSRNRPTSVPAGRPFSAGWKNTTARPMTRPTSHYFQNFRRSGYYNQLNMDEGRWGTAENPHKNRDLGIVDSGCSRSMTGNKEKLDDFVKIVGGTVTFGGGDGKITGKGTTRTSKHVYRVVKALYGLHQAPRAWYARLSTFLLKHNYRRGTIDKTLFIKKNSRDIILVQVYVDDIIFGSTNKAWCDEFEVLMKGEFEMSAM